MKKIVSFTLAAFLAVTSYSLAEEFADMTEEIDAELAAAIENTTEQQVPQAEKVQPKPLIALQAVVPQRKAPQNPQVVQKAPMFQKAQTPQIPQNPYADHVLTRQEIRSMDILDRPNRPGHFYGNTVRRRHGR